VEATGSNGVGHEPTGASINPTDASERAQRRRLGRAERGKLRRWNPVNAQAAVGKAAAVLRAETDVAGLARRESRGRERFRRRIRAPLRDHCRLLLRRHMGHEAVAAAMRAWSAGAEADPRVFAFGFRRGGRGEGARVVSGAGDGLRRGSRPGMSSPSLAGRAREDECPR